MKQPLDDTHYLLPNHGYARDHYTYLPLVPLVECIDRACPDPCHPKHLNVLPYCMDRICHALVATMFDPTNEHRRPEHFPS